jgi:16S rRNA (guanine966-N2)-methyltransferase
MRPRQLRIIGGEFKGKKLRPIKGRSIRPTADRVRESIFNILAFQLPGQIVLDLYAGTGALGIEALSRGASFAYFVDNHFEAIRVIRKNLASCHLSERSQVIQWNIEADLNCLKGLDPAPSLVLMDPPYNLGLVQVSLNNLQNSAAFTSNVTVVIEHAKSEPLPDGSQGFEIASQRVYGKTLVSFLTYMI